MIKRLFLLAFSSLFAGVHAETPEKGGVTHLKAPAAAKLLAREEPRQKPVILDIRTPEEFNGFRIPDSTNIDFIGKGFEAKLGKLDKDQPYLVLCQSGSRSGRSLATFRKLGFTRVYHLDGGILAWMKAELPVQRKPAR